MKKHFYLHIFYYRNICVYMEEDGYILSEVL